MCTRLSRLSLSLFGLCLVAGSGVSAGHASGAPAPRDAVAQRYYPEVRLRKLHLVRPDLIPFPIEFDIYC